MGNGLICKLFDVILEKVVSDGYDRLKGCRGKQKEKQEESQKLRENRPELKIVDYKEFLKGSKRKVNEECDINIFLTNIDNVSANNDGVWAHYNAEYFNEKDWCCVIYKFKKVGKTDIRCIKPVCTCKRDTVLININTAKEYLKHELLGYSILYDKKIYVGDTFTMKICYHKECIPTGVFSANMVMALEDSNNNFWEQPLFAPENKIYESYPISYKEYQELSSVEKVVECFKNPSLW